jgi:GR25 family glycosyltransferase involved in LPS biosynthesis
MKCLIISLSRVPSSAKSSARVLKQLLEWGHDAELFEGTYGHEAKEIFDQENRSLHPYSFKGALVDDEYIEKSYRPGVLGCFYSHYRAWKRCAELGEPILIFEDDVIFYRDYMPVEWQDILLLVTGKRAHDNEFYQERLIDPQGEPQALGFKGKVMPGAVGYGITPQGAAKLLERYAHTFLPADNALNASVVDLVCHTHLMGRAAIDEDGKKSLTKSSNFWEKFT